MKKSSSDCYLTFLRYSIYLHQTLTGVHNASLPYADLLPDARSGDGGCGGGRVMDKLLTLFLRLTRLMALMMWGIMTLLGHYDVATRLGISFLVATVILWEAKKEDEAS